MPIITVTPTHPQVMLYCLMLSDVYRRNIPAGLLYYMKESHTQLIPIATNEIRGYFFLMTRFFGISVIFFLIFKALLVARNHLARYHGNHWDHMTLPEMIRERHTCRHCPLLKQCTLHNK